MIAGNCCSKKTSYEVYYVHLSKNIEYESELEASRAVYTAHR